MSMPERGTQAGALSSAMGCGRLCAEASNGARSGSKETGVMAVVRWGAVEDIWVRTADRM